MSTSSAPLRQPIVHGRPSPSERLRLRVSQTSRWPRVLAATLTLLMVLAIGEIVVDGAQGSSPLIPFSPDISGWLAGLGEPLGYRIFLIALVVFTCSYAGMIALRRRLSTRWVVGLIVLLQVMVFVGPVLISTDVFSYIAYARMGVDHGVNPYLHGALSIRYDPIYEFVGSDWRHAATAYGPIYTLLSYPLGLLSLTGALWAMKAEALLGSLGTIALTWHCAGRRGFDQRLAVLIVGLNPLWVIYGLGGAHNDLLMTLFMMGAVALTLSNREASAAVSVVVGTLIKATVGVLLPFMLVASDLKQLDVPASVAEEDRFPATASPTAAPLAASPGDASPATIPTAATADRNVDRAGATPMRRSRWRVRPRDQRLAVLVGAIGAAVAGAIAAYLAFGSSGVNLVAALNRDSALVSVDAFPDEIAHLLGKPGVFPVDHELLKVLLVLIVIHLLWRTWRGYDWVAASGWALLAIVVTSTWLLPWYTLWSLPLAVIVRDRRLLVATLLVQGLFIVHQLAPMFATATVIKT